MHGRHLGNGEGIPEQSILRDKRRHGSNCLAENGADSRSLRYGEVVMLTIGEGGSRISERFHLVI